MRILILLLYWERPYMVRNALSSVLKANQYHSDWELAFIDDSSPTPGKPICEEILADHLDKVRFFNTDMSVQEKAETGGMVGKLMNQAMRESDADVAIMLCDDDELHPEYLSKLSDWFEANENHDACYSHVIPYNPIFESSEDVPIMGCSLNHTEYLHPFTRVDASQVAWRLPTSAKFDEHRTKCLDAHFYQQLGMTPFSGFIGQYKGIHVSQLGHWECEAVWGGRTIDIPNGEVLTPVAEIFSLIEKYLNHGMKKQAADICRKGIELHPHTTEFYKYLSVIHQ